VYNIKFAQFVAHTWAYRYDDGCWHLVQRDMHVGFRGGFLTSVTFPYFANCFMLRPPPPPHLQIWEFRRKDVHCTCFWKNNYTRSYANAATLKPLRHVVACITVTYSLLWIPKSSCKVRYSQSSVTEDSSLLGSYAMWTGKKNDILRDGSHRSVAWSIWPRRWNVETTYTSQQVLLLSHMISCQQVARFPTASLKSPTCSYKQVHRAV
jgi:hypothetical protein